MSSDAAPAELRSHSDAVIAFLRALPASDFRVPGSLVQIPATASVVDALKLLSDANVTGAPVYDDATTSVRIHAWVWGGGCVTRGYGGAGPWRRTPGTPYFPSAAFPPPPAPCSRRRTPPYPHPVCACGLCGPRSTGRALPRAWLPLHSCACHPLPRQVVTAGLYAHAVPVVSRKYLGFVDVSDLALMVVSKGLTRPSPEGILARVGSLFTTDVEHLVENAINLSGNDPFCGLSLSGNLAQVRVCVCCVGCVGCGESEK